MLVGTSGCAQLLKLWRKMYTLFVPRRWGGVVWCARMEQLSLCSQVLLPGGFHSVAGAGNLHFQSVPEREDLVGALQRGGRWGRGGGREPVKADSGDMAVVRTGQHPARGSEGSKMQHTVHPSTTTSPPTNSGLRTKATECPYRVQWSTPTTNLRKRKTKCNTCICPYLQALACMCIFTCTGTKE